MPTVFLLIQSSKFGLVSPLATFCSLSQYWSHFTISKMFSAFCRTCFFCVRVFTPIPSLHLFYIDNHQYWIIPVDPFGNMPTVFLLIQSSKFDLVSPLATFCSLSQYRSHFTISNMFSAFCKTCFFCVYYRYLRCIKFIVILLSSFYVCS